MGEWVGEDFVVEFSDFLFEPSDVFDEDFHLEADFFSFFEQLVAVFFGVIPFST